MVARSQKLKRLANVQRQIERAAQVELGVLNRERALVGERMARLTEALASPDPVHAGFSKLYGSQLGRLKLLDQQLAGRVRLQESRYLSEKTRARRLGEDATEAQTEEAREAADEAVYDLLDALTANSRSSLR